MGKKTPLPPVQWVMHEWSVLHNSSLLEEIGAFAQANVTKENIDLLQLGLEVYEPLCDIAFHFRRAAVYEGGRIKEVESIADFEKLFHFGKILEFLRYCTPEKMESGIAKTLCSDEPDIVDSAKELKELVWKHELFKLGDLSEAEFDSLMFSAWKESNKKLALHFYDERLASLRKSLSAISLLFAPFFDGLRESFVSVLSESEASLKIVTETMEALGLRTSKELSEISGVTEKTIAGWKKKISPIGKIMLELLVENHRLKEASRQTTKDVCDEAVAHRLKLRSLLREVSKMVLPDGEL